MAEFKVPTETVTLPSKGLLYPKESPLSKGEIEMKYMTAKEEDILTNAPDAVSRAKFSAQRERSIGIGALGFHAYLQRNGIAFEGVMAKVANNKMFKHIRSKLNEANLELGAERGSPSDCAGTGLRFAHVMAVAPNADF